jgi:CheY-like chemotaxis protein
LGRIDVSKTKMQSVQIKRSLGLLVVEDNPSDVRLIREALQEVRAKVTITVARDGKEALDLLQSPQDQGAFLLPDLILLDLNLPGIDGHEVLARLKQNQQTQKIPVIVFSSSRAESDVRRAYDLHANAYVRKPSTLEGLINAAKDLRRFWLEIVTLPNPDIHP